jgi:benzil reductase ((S)-benzoin forming)
MNKIYIITGASKGLGEAFVDQILKEKNTFVVSVSRRINSKQIDYVKAGRFLLIEQDLSKPIDYSGFKKLKKVISTNSKIIFINNAATINPLGEVCNLNDGEIRDALNINILSPVLIIKYLLQYFARNEMSFINITSGAANKAISSWSVYSSSKAFINRFFEILKEENKDNNNCVFKSIDPGMIDTEMQSKIRSTEFPLRHIFDEAKQNGTLLTPAEAAKRVLNELS